MARSCEKAGDRRDDEGTSEAIGQCPERGRIVREVQSFRFRADKQPALLRMVCSSECAAAVGC
jgi:hypothetical protein